MRINKSILAVFAVLIIFVVGFVIYMIPELVEMDSIPIAETVVTSPNGVISLPEIGEREVVEELSGIPMDMPAQRVTKKPFGIFISPDDSPVDPERFRGYHTGVDFEVLPGEESIPVAFRAICDGDIIAKQRVAGYGGVVVQKCVIEDGEVTVLYGHIALNSVALNIGARVLKGMDLGVLGRGYSDETDGERKHLHLSIHRGPGIVWSGYVVISDDLRAWVDPEVFLGF